MGTPVSGGDGDANPPPLPPLGVPPRQGPLPIEFPYCEFCKKDIGAFGTRLVDGTDNRVCKLCLNLHTLTVKARTLPQAGHFRSTLFERHLYEILDLLERLRDHDDDNK